MAKPDFTVLKPLVETQYNVGYDGAKSLDEYVNLAYQVKTDAARVNFAWLENVGDFSEFNPSAGRTIKAVNYNAFYADWKTYDNTIGVNMYEASDGSFLRYEIMGAEALGAKAKEHKVQLLGDLLKNGETGLCYDGQPFFSETHPVINGDGDTVDVPNLIAGTDNGFIIGRFNDNPYKPLIFATNTNEDYKMEYSDELVFQKRQIAIAVTTRVVAAYGKWQYAVKSKKALTDETFWEAYLAMTSMPAANSNYGTVANNPDTIIVPGTSYAAALSLFNTSTLPNGGANPLYGMVKVIRWDQAF